MQNQDECLIHPPRGNDFSIVLHYLKKRYYEAHGFMGFTHSLSAIALFLTFFAFWPDYFERLFGTYDVWVVTLACIVTAGAALINDLDNSVSTAENSLGLLGNILSAIFRGSSVFLQTTIRTKRDDLTPNPHRGAWHTIPAALFLGGMTILGTRIGGSTTLPMIGNIEYGTLVALLITYILVHLSLSSIGKDFMKSIKTSGPLGELIAFVVSFVVTYSIFVNLPKDLDYWWLGVSVALGMIIHIVGDAFTTAGVPILFPLSAKLKGKFWWNTRFTSIKAGGVVERYLFVPFFGVLIVLSGWKFLSTIFS